MEFLIKDSWKLLNDRYELYIIDLWGVLMDGEKIFPHAIQYLENLKRMNKEVVLLSNTPMKAKPLGLFLDSISITEDLYRSIITPGEIINDGLEYFRSRDLNSKYSILGDIEHDKLLEETSFIRVSDIEEADFIVVTAYTDLLADKDLLRRLVDKKIPMFCPNPDRSITMLDGEVRYCAGKIAHLYADLGGDVIFLGKPYPVIFERALKEFSTIDKSRTVMIGDTEATDIRGAIGVMIDSAFVNQEEISEIATYNFNNFTK